MRDIAVFSGSAHPRLAEEVCAHLGVPLSPARVSRFANDCLEVQLRANCRERDVFLLQPLVRPVQEHLVELLMMCDAARGASAARITVVMPHYSYARSDKKDTPRISLGGRLVADLTVLELLDRLRELGPRSIRVACTHGLFAAGALKRLGEQPDVLEIVCTNTVPVPEDEHSEKLRVLSIAPALAEAVRRIHDGESVSALFEQPAEA
ncbi:ribose-phosphate diphosphokinase [Streptomyces sp. NPDC085596]|uniref:ribose-phosphate diphosphokinase n=1 Tax=Streptomyces sp. NPDC085596 TaxID=3365731 RepID=UPI0037D159AD